MEKRIQKRYKNRIIGAMNIKLLIFFKEIMNSKQRALNKYASNLITILVVNKLYVWLNGRKGLSMYNGMKLCIYF